MRVCVVVDSVAVARATTRGIGVWFGVVARAVAVRAAVPEFVARAVVARVVADFVVSVVLRGVNVDVRIAVRVDFVELARRCVVFVVPFFAREATPPSRTAAYVPPVSPRHNATKIRTFFISDEMLANL